MPRKALNTSANRIVEGGVAFYRGGACPIHGDRVLRYASSGACRECHRRKSRAVAQDRRVTAREQAAVKQAERLARHADRRDKLEREVAELRARVERLEAALLDRILA